MLGTGIFHVIDTGAHPSLCGSAKILKRYGVLLSNVMELLNNGGRLSVSVLLPSLSVFLGQKESQISTEIRSTTLLSPRRKVRVN